ncbi:hypothetical protein [Novosphingobium panipatense]|uniref:Terminase family protein n=2 Tax=Novosphingobium panipatense TaxID=428991 RepID=A0ABY1Q7Y8_9SPHN|nr:hypothetical protein [Novosphingobium panipatense]SMP58388.1 hypothetical protein SAMN06296065_102461 [Novosphingobium panipatense]
MSSPANAERRKATRKRLLEDYEFYARKVLKIRTKDARVIPFQLNRAQLRFLEMVIRQWKETGRVRIVILKARQLGLSTVIGGFLYWWISQHKATKGIVVTHKGEATSALFDMTKRFHAEMIPLLKPHTERANARELKFDKLDSGYMVATAGADTVGRGETLQLAHLSEVGLWPKGKAREIMNGLLQAIPEVEDTFVFVESTARGMSGPFYEICQGAQQGTNGYLLCFIPWFMDEKYAIPVTEDFVRTHEEHELALKVLEEYGDVLTDEQLLFRRRKIALDGEPLWNQEYPTFPKDAFLTSGAPVFNLMKLHARLENLPDILHRMDYCPIEQTMKPDPRGRLLMYAEINPHEEYTIGVDVSKGTGGEGDNSEGDWSVAQVLDSKKRQVAVWRGKVEPDYLATILYHLGMLFNEARMGIEFNNHGILPNTLLFKTGIMVKGETKTYGNLYVREVYDKTTDETREELGFYTDVKTRPLIIDELRSAVREDVIQLNDATTIDEMTSFVADPKTGKIEHEVGCHDDCVMALAIANHIHEGAWSLIENQDDDYFEIPE